MNQTFDAGNINKTYDANKTFNAGTSKRGLGARSMYRTFVKTPKKTSKYQNLNKTYHVGMLPINHQNSPNNRTFNAQSPRNQTFKAQSPRNQTFKAQSPRNQTFNAENPINQTFNAQGSRNQTFNAQNPVNQTYVAQSAQNQTYVAQGAQNQTFNAQSPRNQTFNAQNPINQTYVAQGAQNQTYNAQALPNQTFNVQVPNNQTYNVQIQPNQTFDVVNPLNQTYGNDGIMIGPEAQNLQFSSEDRMLLYKIELICTEIRSFIMSAYKFFCNNLVCENWESIYRLIGEMDLTTQSIINEIYVQQMRIDDEREATHYSSDLSGSNYATNTDDQESQSILEGIRRRIDHLNVSSRSADSLLEGLLNIRKAETNLRRFKNYENVNVLTDSRE